MRNTLACRGEQIARAQAARPRNAAAADAGPPQSAPIPKGGVVAELLHLPAQVAVVSKDQDMANGHLLLLNEPVGGRPHLGGRLKMEGE